MLISLISARLATVLLSAPPVLAIDKPVNPALSTKLKMALTHLDFWNTLSDDDMVYDFSCASTSPFTPGSVLNANAATWPLLMQGGQTVAQLNLGPCAMLAPHMHPRATNIVVSVAGSVRTYMRVENGAVDRQTVLTPGKMTIFPRASFHAMVNEACTNAQLYSFLDHPDPGTLNLAQAFWSVGENVGMQVMPMVHLTDNDWNATGMRIPAVGTGSQEGFEACRRRCGLGE